MLPPLPSTARRLDKGVASDHVGVDGNIVSRYTWLSWQKQAKSDRITELVTYMLTIIMAVKD